jgi:hypothetical protein
VSADRRFSSCYLAALCYFSSAQTAGHFGLHLDSQCRYQSRSVFISGAFDFLTNP